MWFICQLEYSAKWKYSVVSSFAKLMSNTCHFHLICHLPVVVNSSTLQLFSEWPSVKPGSIFSESLDISPSLVKYQQQQLTLI